MKKRINLQIVVLILLGSSSLYACKCSTFGLNEQAERATSIFIGTFIEKEDNEMLFQVAKLYIGDPSSNGQILISQANNSCYKERDFEKGDYLLVFSDDQGIHNCSRTKKVLYNIDMEQIEKFNFTTKVYDQDLLNELDRQKEKLEQLLVNCGKDNSSILNDSETIFLKTYLDSEKINEALEDKKVIFVTGPSGTQITDKVSYFNSIKTHRGGKRISNGIIWLSDEDTNKSGGYDAIITYWVKRFSKRQLKKTIKKAKKLDSQKMTLNKSN